MTLSAWDLFADVAISVSHAGDDFRTADQSAAPIYEKLFWGNNLPAVTPDGEIYTPDWAPDEVATLRTILLLGLNLLAQSTFTWTSP